MQTVTVDWRRFASGYLRLPRGDIWNACCAEAFPKIRDVFTHAGRVFACTGMSFLPIDMAAEADAYPLVDPAVYDGPEPREFTYEGRTGRHRGRDWKLGERFRFVAREPFPHEWQPLLRARFADSPQVESQTLYETFLNTVFRESFSPNRSTAIHAELASELSEFTKDQMRHMLDDDDAALDSPPPSLQLDLGL